MEQFVSTGIVTQIKVPLLTDNGLFAVGRLSSDFLNLVGFVPVIYLYESSPVHSPMGGAA